MIHFKNFKNPISKSKETWFFGMYKIQNCNKCDTQINMLRVSECYNSTLKSLKKCKKNLFFSDQSSVLERLKNKQGKDSFSFNSQVCSTYIHPFQTLQFFSILQLLPNVLLNSSHSVIIVIGEVWHFWAMLPILELSTGFKMDDSSLPPRSSKPKTTFQASLFSQPQLSYCKIRVEA